MCTVTLVLPQAYPRPDISGPLEALAGAEPRGNCYLNSDNLVWYSQGWYYNFAWKRRTLVLNSVSDYNPLPGQRTLPLAAALSSLAMDEVEAVEVRHHQYSVDAQAGDLLRRALRERFGSAFLLSRWSVKNYYGPLPYRKIQPHYLKLLSLAEEAVLKPDQVVLVAAEDMDAPVTQTNMSLMLIDHQENIFKCRLTENRLRITNAAPNGNFRIHDYRNNDINITEHCLERFIQRILGKEPQAIRPVLAKAELLAALKNRRAGRSCLMGRTAFVNVEGNIYIGALSRGRLSLITVYPETSLCPQTFTGYALELLEQRTKTLDA